MARARQTTKTKAANAWREFWQTPEGKLAIGALMARFSVYGAISTTDPTSMAVAVGERNVCAWIAEQVALKDQEFVEERSEIEKMTDSLMAKYGG